MLAKSIFVVAMVALSGLLVSSSPYGQMTYNDGYEQPQSYQPKQTYQAAPAPYQPAPMPSYQQSYQPSYQQSYQPSYQPSYPKYQAPSSAHHSQYDNYYPKQTYSEPMYAPKQYMPQPQMYHQQPTYPAPKPSYSAPGYGSHHDSVEYKTAA